MKNETERLQKVIAQSGLASRRRAEELISAGKVKVNGIAITEQGVKVTPQDVIEVDGKIISREDKYVYYILNKPEGVITSVTDPRGRKTVIDILDGVKERIYPVGRLDYDTSGLLLLTNDGELTYRLTHPSYGVDKTYRVMTKEYVPGDIVKVLEDGVDLADGRTSPAKINRLEKKGNKFHFIEITIHEGKNRQVRRMFEQVGYPIVRLERVRFGPLSLNRLSSGAYRELKKSELNSLREEAGLLNGTER